MLISPVHALRDTPLQIILQNTEIHYLQPYDMTSQHPMLAYKYIHTSYPFSLESSCSNFSEMKSFILLACFIYVTSQKYVSMMTLALDDCFPLVMLLEVFPRS